MKKDKNQYTTIQVSKNINTHIREFCTKNGLVASTLTERLWVHYISSSVSGSIIL
jgi:predicted DNA-binding transcriptional regulator